MKTNRSPAEVEQIKIMLQNNQTFYKVYSENWTKNVLQDLRNRLYGKIPRNFLINISGLIGTPTGIFKSTMGLQIALALDPRFNLQQRVAFSINELLDKVKENSEYQLCNRCYYDFTRTYDGTYETLKMKKEESCDNCDNIADIVVLLTRLIFFLDEQTKTLKTGGLMRLQNLVDTCRQRQICFISCGVDQYGMSYTTYSLKRIQESADDYLPTKRVRFAVYDDEREIYYGYFKWDITPLTDVFWKLFWSEYSVMKTNFQRVAIAQQTQSANFEDYAQEVVDSEEFVKCFRETKSGAKIMQSGLVRNLIFKHFPDLTNDERDYVFAELKMIIYDEDEEV